MNTKGFLNISKHQINQSTGLILSMIIQPTKLDGISTIGSGFNTIYRLNNNNSIVETLQLSIKK